MNRLTSVLRIVSANVPHARGDEPHLFRTGSFTKLAGRKWQSRIEGRRSQVRAPLLSAASQSQGQSSATDPCYGPCITLHKMSLFLSPGGVRMITWNVSCVRALFAKAKWVGRCLLFSNLVWAARCFPARFLIVWILAALSPFECGAVFGSAERERRPFLVLRGRARIFEQPEL